MAFRRLLISAFILSLTLCSYGHVTEIQANDETLTQLHPGETNRIKITTEKVKDNAYAEMAAKIDILSTEDTESSNGNQELILDNLIDAVKEKAVANQFLTTNGIPKIVSSNLATNHAGIKAKVLILLKVLFEVSPEQTSAIIPKSLATKLLDIFEYEDNLALKARALDVLYKWLPNNPEIQNRIIKIKGLEPFYSQIDKLDISVIQTLLDLFNVVLKEHVEARSEEEQITKTEKLVLYQKIGLLERMKTSNFCNGLVNIFQVMWAYNHNGEVVKTVLDLVNNTKPFCEVILKGRSKAVALFETIQKYLKDEAKEQFFNDIELDATDFGIVIGDYIDKVKAKDEL